MNLHLQMLFYYSIHKKRNAIIATLKKNVIFFKLLDKF
jgi:hypothetical protein